jgi:hypothetical protein
MVISWVEHIRPDGRLHLMFMIREIGRRCCYPPPCALEMGQLSYVVSSTLPRLAYECQFMTKVKHYLDQDAILRAACVEMGTHAGAASRPLTREECEGCMVKNTVSQAWRLGRSVALANKSANIGNIGPVLVDALGGPQASRVLFSGKIVEVNRRIFKGHTIGEIVVKAVAAEDEDGEGKERFEGTVTSELAVGRVRKAKSGRATSPSLAASKAWIPTNAQFRSRMKTYTSNMN